MINYRPLPFATRLGQGTAPAAAPAAPVAAAAPAPAAAPVPVTLPPAAEAPAPVCVSYTGVPGFLETVVVLGVVASAAWIGIRTGTSKQPNPYVRTAGWVGGIGSGVLGLLYLGQKAGLKSGLPAVRVTA